MAKGDKKKAFMERTGLGEDAYYAHSRKVCGKRHFNMRVSQLLAVSGFNPIAFLEVQITAFDPDEPENEKDHLLWLVQDCENPMKVLKGYLDYYHNEDHLQELDAHIAELLRSFPEASFRRFGDINQVDQKKFFKRYCDEKGMPIDVQAMEMSEITGKEITPQDIADFAIAHPKGAQSYKVVTWADRLAERYFFLTGNKLNYDFARQLLRMMEDKENLDLSDNTAPF